MIELAKSHCALKRGGTTLRKLAAYIFALVLVLIWGAAYATETPIGLLPDMFWEDTPERVQASVGAAAELKTEEYTQSLTITEAHIFGVEDETAQLDLLYSGGALVMGFALINNADAQKYIDAISLYHGAPVMLGNNEYWAADILTLLSVKSQCYWNLGNNRRIVLSASTDLSVIPSTIVITLYEQDPEDAMEVEFFTLTNEEIASLQEAGLIN